MRRLARCPVTTFLFTFLLLFGLVFGAVGAHGQSLEQRLDQYLTAAARVQHFQGSVLVARAGKTILAKGYGAADVQRGSANGPSTVYLIGSLTKQFTATAIMQLVEQGKIDLNAPLTKYLPDYPKVTGDKVTIRQLLTHTSGIPSYTNLPIMKTDRFTPITQDSLVGLFKNLPLEYEPGTAWRYDNSGYVLLGLIIERVSGEPYPQYLKKHILKPVGMKHTGYLDAGKLPARLARPHTMDSSGRALPTRLAEASWPSSAGALYSTIGDMLRWDQALYAGKVLSGASMTQMFTPVKNSYGYGFLIDSLFDRRHIWHNGRIDGFESTFDRYPDDSLTIVVLTNNDGISVGTVARTLAAIAFGEPYNVPVKKEAIALDSVSLQEYVGVYETTPGQYRIITRVGDSLFAQRSGSGSRRVLAEGHDRFFFAYDNALTLTFGRDTSGRVDRHSMRQAGEEIVARRVSGAVADSLLRMFAVVGVDPSLLVEYAGEYELGPGFVLTISLQDGHIFAQATGQPQVEIFARTPETFVVRQVWAELTFVRDSDGRVGSLMLNQNGHQIPGKRVK